MRIALVGYGNVARAFARLLERKRSVYPNRVVAIHTARHGTAYDPKGLAVEPQFGPAAATIEEFLDRARAEVLIEVTTLNPESGEPAISHVRAAYERRMHVITANKGPVAFAYRALKDEARRAGVEFLYEATTMDGAPVYNMVRNCLPGIEILGFSGALNSTSKVVLEAMRAGMTLEEGIVESQRLGVAEADPWFDVEGWDSACKAAALANILMKADITPQQIERKGIARLTHQKLLNLEEKGKTVTLLSRARKTPDGVKLRVRAEVLDKDDILAACRGTSNLLVLHTDLMGDMGVFSLKPGVEQTAYGLFTDLVDIARTI